MGGFHVFPKVSSYFIANQYRIITVGELAKETGFTEPQIISAMGHAARRKDEFMKSIRVEVKGRAWMYRPQSAPTTPTLTGGGGGGIAGGPGYRMDPDGVLRGPGSPPPALVSAGTIRVWTNDGPETLLPGAAVVDAAPSPRVYEEVTTRNGVTIVECEDGKLYKLVEI